MNEIEKAIEYFYNQMEIGKIESDYQQAIFETAISALEKQIPKKIDHDYLSCNSCDGDLEVFARMDIVHCPWCGQRLDWSAEE